MKENELLFYFVKKMDRAIVSIWINVSAVTIMQNIASMQTIDNLIEDTLLWIN